MNNVVFVMANSKLGKKKEASKAANYDTDHLCLFWWWLDCRGGQGGWPKFRYRFGWDIEVG